MSVTPVTDGFPLQSSSADLVLISLLQTWLSFWTIDRMLSELWIFDVHVKSL